MRRREFIAGLVVAGATGRAQAQQTGKVYRIAMAHPSHAVGELSESGSLVYYRAFFRRLRELGYVEGQNLAVERYSGEGRTEHFGELVREVVRGNPDLVFVATSRLTREFKAATDAIPVVAVLADPIGYGIVSNLARPAGNITGITVDAGVEIWGKRLELLREMVPTASRVAYLASRAVWESPQGDAVREAAQRNKMSVVGLPLAAPFQETEYHRVFAAMAEAGADALIVGDQGENVTNRRLIVGLADNARLPAIYPYREFTEIGGLMAYLQDLPEVFRHAADQIDQILKGTKPGDIPFYQPTKFQLIINLKTAKALGITVPPTLLIAADEVIE